MNYVAAHRKALSSGSSRAVLLGHSSAIWWPTSSLGRSLLSLPGSGLPPGPPLSGTFQVLPCKWLAASPGPSRQVLLLPWPTTEGHITVLCLSLVHPVPFAQDTLSPLTSDELQIVLWTSAWMSLPPRGLSEALGSWPGAFRPRRPWCVTVTSVPPT